ncbi:hypothetical protein JCM5353_008173 [Sporobolomyces roseus]
MAPPRAKQSQSGQRLKVIVRRLPPDLPPAVFWKTVQPWVPQGAVEGGDQNEDKENNVAWSVFKQGKVRKSGKDKDSLHSRAYISFKNPDALVAFHRGYDGWSFKDKTGNVTQAVVEFAPYQKMPTPPSKPDPRQGTIDQDPDFLAFQIALTAPPDPADTPAEPLPDHNPKSTPLLEHLRAQKAATLATRKAAMAALKKGKGAAIGNGRDDGKGKEVADKGGKKTRKDKKGGKGGGKSKEASRSGTPVPSNGVKNVAGGGRTPSGSGTPRPPQHPKSRDPPGVVFPPGSFGAQQAAAAKAQQAAAQQAERVRQQLQRQHQQTSQTNPASKSAASDKPQPMILKNPARQTPIPSSASSTSASLPSMPPSLVGPPPSQAIPKGPKADVAGQRRQVGAAIGAALNEGGNGAGAKRGRGRGGARGNGRGNGAARGGRGGGRGGTAATGAPS